MGFRTIPLTDPDLYPLDVLAVILGDGRTSELYQVVKDERELLGCSFIPLQTVACVRLAERSGRPFGNYMLFFGLDIFRSVVYLIINVATHKNILS